MRTKQTGPRDNGGNVAPCASFDNARSFTPKQGQYLAFIYYYTKIRRMPPAEADFRQFFRVTPPTERHNAAVFLGGNHPPKSLSEDHFSARADVHFLRHRRTGKVGRISTLFARPPADSHRPERPLRLPGSGLAPSSRTSGQQVRPGRRR